jgi:predicted TIM-barrel fold metal-dependent hydrolase
MSAVGVSGRRSDRVLVVSADGHAMAHMAEYRGYLPSRFHEDFDAFCVVYAEHGARAYDPVWLAQRTDPEVVEQWTREVLGSGDRLEGASDPAVRLAEMDRDGRAADVLFPDFGLPFEMGSLFFAAVGGYTRTPEQIDAGYRAHNRWLVDFCAVAPERFIPMACINFADVEAAVEEIRWAHESGLKGVLLPAFEDDVPLFDPRFEPIWSTVEELGLPVNSHISISSITTRMSAPPVPHPACAFPLTAPKIAFNCRQILGHLIWGGVLERHPEMKVIFTEQGSGWVVGELANMDYSYEGSYLRRDIREVVGQKPSEYFRRQCYLGSSIFSREEIELRHKIGIDKMMLGMDYPHHEGTWAAGPGSREYLRATLGAAQVPEDEARMLLADNAVSVWNLDVECLGRVADRIGPSLDEVLTPPTTDWYPRGDVKKPAAAFK